MADEKKAVDKEVASKADKKAAKVKKPSKFSPKNIGKAIARFFKDLRGETKKIVWPNRHMVIKSTGVVLAAILVIGAGVWILDYALSGGITALTRLADKTEVTETVEDEETEDKEETEGTDADESEETSEEASDEAESE